ncbi:ABC transporter ATP-binding protein [Prochlorococcus sp. MIT 1223]|uniref:ABC transporter ATP-binding protein n=1 Tax=Prochlorococcus sp. MIT 1223 TaxID=3096217 RepID=UPI002A762703|nr:ABC transporter ATP-binding protein [Prochlorococcus sp. MIT 1223]
MKEIHLEIIDLWHRHVSSDSKSPTLKSISLNINKGELIGLVGPSGCGKTTLLRLIAGFESPIKGRILLSGKEISSNSRLVPPEKRGIGMVFQDYALFPHLSVWKNVCFGLNRRSDSKRAKWLLDLLGLSELIDRYPHQLSGGQKQRLALARALAPGTSIVLLDEPFNSLDLQVRIRLRNELSDVLKTCSATGIFVTHDSQEALAICDRVAVMKDGELHQCDSSKQLRNNPRTSFVGEFVFQKNTIPIKFNDNKFSTPLGKVSLNESNITNPDILMFDPEALIIDSSEKSNCIIKSIEYYNTYSIITVKLLNILLRVKSTDLNEYSIGQECYIRFKNKQPVLLYPGSHKSEIN